MMNLNPELLFKNKSSFFLIAGPCVIENTQLPMQIAAELKAITTRLHIPFIFKASYRKANRSRIDSFTGIGDLEGLELLKEIRNSLQVPVLTDVHTPQEAEIASEYVDILQIPAFLCRQTELLVAAGRTGKAVNIKKGQFVSPQAMQYAVQKVKSVSDAQILLTERGTTFGYQDLIVDMRSIPWMKTQEVPVVLDVTHSLQQPNQPTGVTGGMPELIRTIASAGIAAGADGIFMETHPNPANAKSDSANMLPLQHAEELLMRLQRIYNAINH
ncbi:MAG: 3-deoxy-8-phosphooctulonate synthase [Bacteroidia bacterium]|nr:3-deoxy-8-phosphooctulonate synthase [Bacteroidales bacterium]NCD41545.1 3-deoxy-8-phosphooctulonate synthase [Bacteroidia bacterium]MDD2323648.1 3-deoxy-8-phosphooctulonate synthase [Bacteroidales bacterium]MDD3961836.1 3-deoxy-8-phosphooctulonate synthase [Bacteroidales bacterium]MDY0286233.1 3-deoxy-8-phosphooctulonate synthase [Bacteroidales bacterium]